MARTAREGAGARQLTVYELGDQSPRFANDLFEPVAQLFVGSRRRHFQHAAKIGLAVKIELGDRRELRLDDVEIGPGRLGGRASALLRTQAGFHGGMADAQMIGNLVIVPILRVLE